MIYNFSERILSSAGIAVNGSNPCYIQVKDDRTFSQVLKGKNMGLGEAYIAGW
ncbi:MAG: hypothetical protein ABRQ35_02795 [Smithellaceae bacterium]